MAVARRGAGKPCPGPRFDAGVGQGAESVITTSIQVGASGQVPGWPGGPVRLSLKRRRSTVCSPARSLTSADRFRSQVARPFRRGGPAVQKSLVQKNSVAPGHRRRGQGLGEGRRNGSDEGGQGLEGVRIVAKQGFDRSDLGKHDSRTISPRLGMPGSSRVAR